MIPDRLALDALDKYTEWLNAWHAFHDGADHVPLTRDDMHNAADPPNVLSVTITGDYRTTMIHCNPFLDEGGPHALIVIHDRMGHDDEWSLGCIIQSFDTRYTMVWEDHQLQGDPFEKVADGVYHINHRSEND